MTNIENRAAHPDTYNYLAGQLPSATGFTMNLYCPPVLQPGQQEEMWLVRGNLLGVPLEVPAPDGVWEQVRYLARTLSPVVWPITLERDASPEVVDFLSEKLGMPGMRARWVEDSDAVAMWVAWNREALRAGRVFEKSHAPESSVLEGSEDAIRVDSRFVEEVRTFVELPELNQVNFPEERMASYVWKLAIACRDLAAVDERRHAVLGTAGLNTEDDYIDLREWVHRGCEDAQVVLTTIEQLEAAETSCLFTLDSVASDLEFEVRDRRMSRKRVELAAARNLVEALKIPA